MRTPRTPRGRASLAALAVGGGVALVIGITGSSAVAGSIGTTTTDYTPPPPPPVLIQPLTVSKSAYLFYTRVNSWDIDKWASPQAGWDKKDQSVAVDYSVKVTKSWKAVNIRVFGEITVNNPNAFPFAALVGDDLPGGTCAIMPQRRVIDEVAAAGLLPIEPGSNPVKVIAEPGDTVLRYVCTLDKLPKRKIVNTAWVKWAPFLIPVDVQAVGNTPTTIPAPDPEWIGEAKGTADVVASAARYRDVNGAVKVIDTLDGDQTRLLDEHLTDSKTFTYRRYLSYWRMKKICRTWDNVAKVAPAPKDEILMPTLDVAPELRMLPEIPEIAPPMPVPDWSKTDSATVKICPPPAPVKGEDPKPPVVEVTGPGDTKTDPVEVKPSDNPKGPVVKDNKSKGRLLVTKAVRGPRVAEVGDVVTWVIRVKNIGKAELYDVKVTDVLPPELIPVASETNKGGAVLGTIKDLAPGEAEVFVVRTLVKGKPAPTPDAIAQTRKLKTSKERNEAVLRLRRGLVCNVARATTKKGPSDSDITCVRIVRRPVVEQPAG